MSLNYIERAETWLSNSFDKETVATVKEMISKGSNELEDAFYKNLEFGTGGLRGVMGIGTNRINKYTVGMATQGFANYLLASFPEKEDPAVAIAFDNRTNSSYFAEITAEVFTANGFKVYLFEQLRPTPELSFAIRHYKCVGGVMLTASHNPKEYNGYKVYWDDGAQVTAPHDSNIIKEVLKVENPSMVKFQGDKSKIEIIGKETDEAYLNAILSLTLSSELITKENDLKIVYTPLHGTGVKMVPEALKRIGFKNIINVPEQDINDGNFPTVKYPNPEDPEALKMAIERANQTGAHIVMATDPDADRLGIAVRDLNGEMILLNGNQMAALLTYYILERRKEKGLLTEFEGKEGYMVKTIVTTDLMKSICDSYKVDLFNVLTGFKFIAQVVREQEDKRFFIAGGEESYGFNVGEFVRDKDAVISSCFVAEAAIWAKSKGLTLYELLLQIYQEFGFYKEHLISITKKGKDGVEKIDKMMQRFRESPPQKLDGSQVVLIHDYLKSQTVDNISDLRYKITLPKSNVIQFVCSDNTVVSVRPSGTEPKIKFYFGVKTDINSVQEYEAANRELSKKLERLAEQISSI
ncbi:MAG: phospho-sugar mutase [Bacteroidales bacterium]|nr:phospho-sugar mutase [Bacteroidales bacterium]